MFHAPMLTRNADSKAMPRHRSTGGIQQCERCRPGSDMHVRKQAGARDPGQALAADHDIARRKARKQGQGQLRTQVGQGFGARYQGQQGAPACSRAAS